MQLVLTHDIALLAFWHPSFSFSGEGLRFISDPTTTGKTPLAEL